MDGTPGAPRRQRDALAERFAWAAEHDALDLDQAAATLKLPNLAVDEVGGRYACQTGLRVSSG